VALTALIAIVAPAGAALASTASPEAAPASARNQPLAVLLTSQRVLVSPYGRVFPIRAVSALRPITRRRTVLPVVARASTPDGVRWLRVALPGRPNGSSGWIRQSGTTPTTTGWRVVIRTAGRRVLVLHDGRVVRSFRAVVGRPSTPTPSGRFFVEETVRLPRGSAGAPFALALSARSNALRRFEGGPGQIAIHGVANLSGALGTASSHGCIRLDAASVTWVATHVPAGATVTISA